LFFFNKKREKKKGVISLTGEAPREIRLQNYDVTIMNPPFTRQERLPEVYKKLLNQRFDEYHKFIEGQMGFFGYFVLLAERFLNNKGRMALVLPATVLHTRSSEGIRKLWAEKYQIEYLITTWHRLAFSESVVFREILLVAKKILKIKVCLQKFAS
jgi:type I restriction-modification system DNA methylase subunit